MLFFFPLAVTCTLCDLSSLTRDWTCAPAVEAQSPDHWTAREFPQSAFWTWIKIFCSWHLDLHESEIFSVCPTLCNSMDYTVHGILQARILEWVAFPFSRRSPKPRDWMQVSHCRKILYQLSHKGRPTILEWVAYPFSRGSSRPRNWTGVSWIAGGFFTNWANRVALRLACCCC